MGDNKKLGQESAFAKETVVIPKYIEGGGEIERGSKGMSKRFFAASVAMQGILSNPDWVKSIGIKNDWDEFKDRVTSASYEIADELLRKENL